MKGFMMVIIDARVFSSRFQMNAVINCQQTTDRCAKTVPGHT